MKSQLSLVFHPPSVTSFSRSPSRTSSLSLISKNKFSILNNQNDDIDVSRFDEYDHTQLGELYQRTLQVYQSSLSQLSDRLFKN
jgi:hypothetical protein